MDKVEIAPFDNLLVYKKGYTPGFVRALISEKKLGGLRIFSILKDQKLETIDFLNEYDFLEKLDITSNSDFNFSFLNSLVNLKKLSINVEGSMKIDLGGIKKLEHLSIKWRKNIKGVENCISLLSLCLIEYKGKDLMSFQNLCSIKDLRVKTATIESLNGLQHLKKLESLSIGNCKKLISISNISLLPKLKNLELEQCPNIKDFKLLLGLKGLENLSLIDCGEIESIGFIDNMPSLSRLSLIGNTVIKDGDLTSAKKIKTLEHKHYKHYNLKLENLSYNKAINANLNKIKDIFK
jgi:hypothetical protein